MNIIHLGKLRNVEFTCAIGDLFDPKVDAIVNSEQSDFILSSNPQSISGQIRGRYGSTARYLVLETGEIFKLPRGPAAGG
jgi:hypothetical protein